MDRLKFLIPLGIIATIEHVQGDPLEPWLWMLPVGWLISIAAWALHDSVKDRKEALTPGLLLLAVPIIVISLAWVCYVMWAMWSAYTVVGA